MTNQVNGSETPWPLYQQVKNLILRRIESGHWSPGTKIPSENELVESLGISRMTINRAIRELSLEGYLTRKKGAGTFVLAKKSQFALFEIKSIADEIALWGGKHKSEVILLQKETGTNQLCEEMGLKPGSEVYHSSIIHMDRDIPIQLADRLVNPKLAPDYLKQDFTKITPSNYLLKVVSVTEIEHIVETKMPDSGMRTRLKIAKNEPCLMLRRTTWLGDIVATKNCFVYPGSRYTIGGRFSTADLYQPVTA